jgi:predicted phosphodiesterase
MKPKYIRVASDLHLEQLLGQREEFLAMTFVPEDPRDAESVLVLAGDISSKPKQLLEFLGWVEKRFLKVIYVPGNHEFYGHDMGDWTMDMVASIEGYCEKVEFSGCGVICEEMEGVRFIATTLWADGGSTLQEEGDIGHCLNDFRLVKLGDKRFTVQDMKTLNRGQKAKVKEMLEEPFDGKTVVVTHHMPSYSLCHPRFGTAINGGFASHCDDLLKGEHAPDVWIFGHTHDSVDMFFGNSRLVCNPSGYRYEYGGTHNIFGPKFLSIEDLTKQEIVEPMWHSTPVDSPRE